MASADPSHAAWQHLPATLCHLAPVMFSSAFLFAALTAPPSLSISYPDTALLISGLSLPHQPGFFSKLAAMFRGLCFSSNPMRSPKGKGQRGPRWPEVSRLAL